MGILTRAELIQQAGLASGNDQSTSFVYVWLDAWLHRTAKSWAWPVLKRRISSLPLVAGQASVDVGLGKYADIYIHRIFNPLTYRSANYQQRGRIFIEQILSADPDTDPDTTLASNRLGTPEKVKIRSATATTVISGAPPYATGTFSLYFNPVPDKPYLVNLDIHYIPKPDGTTTTAIPWYPNDRTLIQACKCALLELDDGGEEGAASEKSLMKLAAMVVDDRDFDGEGPGDNELMGLDKSVFL